MELGPEPQFWFKVLGMLMQNWALVDTSEPGRTRILFVDDDGAIFDDRRAGPARC